MDFGIRAVKKILSDNGMPLENLEAAASEICGRHKADIDSIKEERDGYKQEAETLADLKKQLKDATDKITAYEKDDYKGKYESEKAEHDKLKADIAGKETYSKKENILRDWMKENQYSEEGSMVILDSREDYVNKLELDKNGKASNLSDITAAIQKKYYMYTPEKKVTKPDSGSPLVNNGNAFDKMSLGEKMKYANEHPTDSAVVSWIGKK